VWGSADASNLEIFAKGTAFASIYRWSFPFGSWHCPAVFKVSVGVLQDWEF